MIDRMIALLLALALQEEGFEPLFNGKDLTGWTFVTKDRDADATKTFRVEEGTIACTGKPTGYLRTEKSYREFTLRFDWRYKRPDDLKIDSDFPGNSGYLLLITGDHKVWPQCIEAQGMNRDAGNILPLGTKAKVEKDVAAQKKAIKSVGEWNSMEIEVKEGAVTVQVNGTRVATASGVSLTEGPLGLQSEGAEIHWRNIRIRAGR